MAQWALLIDYSLCFDCKACEVACKQENNLPVGTDWIKVVTVGPRQVGEKLLVDYIPTTCTHCARPPCADACPTKAIKKSHNGMVVIDEALCDGCLMCITACPFGIIRFNQGKNVVEKCTLCSHRIEKGLKPACVQHCQAGAILFGEINEISRQLMEKRVQRRILSGDSLQV